MKAKLIEQAYAVAKERYAAIGVDTDAVLDLLQKQQLSLHCWQTDDVVGFERNEALSGGIQTTGNYPGRARTIDEVRQDIEFVKTLLGGNHRLNLHEIYGDFGGQFVDRDQVEVKHFQSWMDWAKENNMKLDFNSTSFSIQKSRMPLSGLLSVRLPLLGCEKEVLLKSSFMLFSFAQSIQLWKCFTSTWSRSTNYTMSRLPILNRIA